MSKTTAKRKPVVRLNLKAGNLSPAQRTARAKFVSRWIASVREELQAESEGKSERQNPQL